MAEIGDWPEGDSGEEGRDGEREGLGGLGLERLLKEEGPKLSAILASFRIPAMDADDLLQEALVQLVVKHDRIRKPREWLRGALRNECRMYWRTRGRSLTTAVDTAILDLVAEGGAPKQEREALRKNLLRWIDELDPRCRSILRLRYELGLEPREIAEKLGYKPSSIDKITRRCIEALGRKAAAAEPAPDAWKKTRPGSESSGSNTVGQGSIQETLEPEEARETEETPGGPPESAPPVDDAGADDPEDEEAQAPHDEGAAEASGPDRRPGPDDESGSG